jgi:hypothetical protein
MADSSIDKIATAVAKQGEAIKSFRKRHDARLSDVSKRVEKLEAQDITAVAGYAELYDFCANLIEASPHPKLASAGLLNAALGISLAMIGADNLAVSLRIAADNMAATEAKARGQLS